MTWTSTLLDPQTTVTLARVVPVSSPSLSAGLSAEAAAQRLRQDGPNVLPVPPAPSPWRLLAAQLVHFFALLLWAAAGLAVIAGMPQLGIAIVAIVVLNGVFAFAQEHRAERAAERLRDLLPRRMTVIRDGQPQAVDAADIVVGDAVLLTAGDRISADLRLVENHQLGVDTSMLTGESVAASPTEGERLFAGTFIVEGEAIAEVIATGAATRLAGLAQLTRAGHRPPSPLARELDHVVRTIALIAIGLGIAFFAVGLLVGLPPSAGFLFAIGVSVALVPEGLLPTVTLSLAVAAQRMATRHALVRRLEAVETLGSTTFICTDKTGTLTRNQMAVVEVWTPDGTSHVAGRGYEPIGVVDAPAAVLAAVKHLALAARRCSRGRAVQRGGQWQAEGDPMEAALDVLARRLDVDVGADEAANPGTRRIPFDPRRRRMSVVAGDQIYTKGAPEAVLPLCRQSTQADGAVNEMARRGLRVLAIAGRTVNADEGSAAAELLERDLVLLGLVGLEDPPRPNAAPALAACRAAGIRVAMITGDHPATAAAIAREVGLQTSTSVVLDGSDLPADLRELGELVDHDGIVVSRVSPEDKLRIARALRARGHVVAMTGDGVNDGPALHEADIGVAMGLSGTDVAREAADLVLLDDDFTTIVAAIEQGRATFGNIRRCLTYHLTDNVAELTPFVCWALSAGQIPLALTVLQILCLDAGTDQLPALGLGIEPPGPHVLEQPLQGRHLLDRGMLFRVFGVLGPTEAIVEMSAFAAVLIAGGWGPEMGFPNAQLLAAASGAAFAAVVVGQAATAFACRSSSRWAGALGWTRNRFLVAGVGIELALLVGFVYIAPLAALLGQAPPPAVGWAVALLAAPAVLATDALHKRYSRRTHTGMSG